MVSTNEGIEGVEELPKELEAGLNGMKTSGRLRRLPPSRCKNSTGKNSFDSEPFAIGPVQFSWTRGMAENWFTKPGFGNILSVFPRKNSKTQSSLNFFQSGPRKFTKSGFSGLAPIRRVLINQRKTKGGENSGEGKTYHKSPPQKRFGPPHLWYDFPPFVHAMSFSLEETGTDQTNPTFWGLQNWFWRGCFMVRFPPPKSHDTFCPPPPLRIPKKGNN